MTKREIIERIATERRVEKMVGMICGSGRPELQDLAQIVYLALLGKSEETVVKSWEEGWINFLLIRIIKNQWQTSHSTFRDMFTKYSRRAEELAGHDRAEDP